MIFIYGLYAVLLLKALQITSQMTHLESSKKSLKNMLGEKFYDGRKIVLPLAENASVQLLNHWIQQAASGFMAAFAKKRVESLNAQSKKQFRQCSEKANSVNKHAACIIDLLKMEKIKRRQIIRNRKVNAVKKRLPAKVKRLQKPKSRVRIRSKQKAAKLKEDDHWIGAFRMMKRLKRMNWEQPKPKQRSKIVNRKNYKLLSEKEAKTALGTIVRGVKRFIEKLKQKKISKSWPVTVEEMRSLAIRMQKRQNFLEALKIRTYNGLKNISSFGADETNPETDSQKLQSLAKLFRRGLLLALSITNHNISNMQNKTIRMASPRFFALSPDSDSQDEVRLFSPSLLSLHNDGIGLERKWSISRLLDMVKMMNAQDQNELLELIFEASGLSDSIQKIHDKLKSNSEIVTARGIDGQPLYFTKENVTELYGKMEAHKIDTFDKLYKTLNKQQIADLNDTGYAVLSKEQLQLMYGHRSPYHHPIALERLSTLLDQHDGLQRSLENDFKKLTKSENFGLDPRKLSRRQKRFGVVLSPFLLSPFILAPGTVSQPIVLSPVVLSPVILSPAVFGPFILSPWVFNPLVLSPRVLAPFIISPIIFSPIVLSPLALHPFILSPGISNPFVLSPLALSPFILSPQIATPLILTPLILNPLILNPMAFSPLILSPFALSPLIYSPQYVFALVLSPYFLSPQIESKLIQSTVIMSPSALS